MRKFLEIDREVLVIDTKERKLMKLNWQESVLISFQQNRSNWTRNSLSFDKNLTISSFLLLLRLKIVLMTYH